MFAPFEYTKICYSYSFRPPRLDYSTTTTTTTTIALFNISSYELLVYNTVSYNMQYSCNYRNTAVRWPLNGQIYEKTLYSELIVLRLMNSWQYGINLTIPLKENASLQEGYNKKLYHR